MSKEKKSKRRDVWPIVLALVVCLIVFVISAIFTLQLYIESYSVAKDIQQAADSFVEQRNSYILDEKDAVSDETDHQEYMPELLTLMQEYNQAIYENGQENLEDAWSYQAEPFDLTEYGVEDGIVGVISIPKIDVELPLYVGATYSNLLSGAAILTETSMPIGGENTNCVIAAHRGWNEIPFVRNIEEVEIGDSIFIENLWETLEYRVTEIKIIYPYESQNILIQERKDMVTLVTCHPYRVNTHRYLVIAERYYEDAEAAELDAMSTSDTTSITISRGIEFESSQKDIFLSSELPLLILFVVLVLFILIILFLLFRYFWQKRKKKYHPKHLS